MPILSGRYIIGREREKEYKKSEYIRVSLIKNQCPGEFSGELEPQKDKVYVCNTYMVVYIMV